MLPTPESLEGKPVPNVTFKARPHDQWRDISSDELFKGKTVIVFSLPGVPGQGILTVVVGILLMDFPGKKRLERRIIGIPRVLEAINRLRRNRGREPMIGRDAIVG